MCEWELQLTQWNTYEMCDSNVKPLNSKFYGDLREAMNKTNQNRMMKKEKQMF